MTPVFQSKLYVQDGIHSGNCYAACLASLLDLPLWMVPPFEDMFTSHAWKQRTQDWLDRMFKLRLSRFEGHPVVALPEFYIASGLSARDVMHSVIYRKGELCHDPHPSGAGVLTVEWCSFLEPVSND